MEKKRNVTYDYLRGLAMLLIVLGHLYFYSKRHVGSLAFSICDTVELPVFMYISGLLAHVSVDRYGLRKLIASKVVRLLFPLVSFYIIWGVCDASNFETFWLKTSKKGYWFLLVLFELMVTLSLVKRVSSKYQIKSVYVNVLIYVLVTLYMYLLPQDSVFNNILNIKRYWLFYPFFMMGYYSYRLEKFLILKYAPVFLVLYLCSFYLYMNGNRSSVVMMACYAFSLFFMMTVFSTSFKPLKTIFSFVGVYSLQVYMIHFFLLFPLLEVWPVIENRWLEFLCFLAMASVLTAASIGIAKLLMRSDWLAMFLFGIRRK